MVDFFVWKKTQISWPFHLASSNTNAASHWLCPVKTCYKHDLFSHCSAITFTFLILLLWLSLLPWCKISSWYESYSIALRYCFAVHFWMHTSYLSQPSQTGDGCAKLSVGCKDAQRLHERVALNQTECNFSQSVTKSMLF